MIRFSSKGSSRPSHIHRCGLRSLVVCALGISPFAASVSRATEDDVKNGSTDLTTSASYTQGLTPAPGIDVTFKGTYSSGANRIFFVNGAGTNLNIGTLDDISASPLTIENSTVSTASTITLNGGTDAVTGSSTGDLIFLAGTGQSLTIGAGSVGTMTVSLATAGNIDIGATSSLTISTGTTLAGSNAITKTGTGTLAFGASALNTTSGGLTIANGTVTVAGTNNSILGANGNTVTLGQASSANNATLSFSSSPTGLLANLATQGSGTDTVTSTSTSNTAFATGQTISLGNTLHLSSTGSVNGTLTLGGTISGSSGIVVDAANLGTIDFGGSNSFSGGLTVNSGTINSDSATNALGANGNAVDLGGGGTANVTLRYGTTDLAVGQNFTTTGSGVETIARTADTNAVLGFSGTFTLNNTINPLTVNVSRPSAIPKASFNGVISGAGGFTLGATNNAQIYLTAANTYTGTTTIGGTANTSSTSTLSLGNGGTTGSLSTIGGASGTGSAIVDNSVFAINRSNTVIQGTDFTSSAITGTGAFIQAGTGTTSLTAADAYTGTTTISAGTLQLGNGGTTGSLSTSSVITDNGTLSFNRTNTTTQGTDFSGSAITGTGKLTQVGSGTTILTAANSETGTTTISAGTLQLGNGGTTGSLSPSSVITDNATLVINRSDTPTQGTDFSSAAITGTGALSITGTGTTVLTAANSYSGGTTINSGATLQLGNGTLTGSIAGTVLDNGALTVNNPAASTNSIGAITGTGSLSIGGAGNTTLTANVGAANSYSGSTTIGSGASLTLTSGAKLTGTSSITDNGLLIFSVASNTPSQLSNLNNKPVTGTGGLTFTSTSSAASLSLTQANTYTGATTITNGTLQIGGTLGALSPSSAITDNGTFSVNRTNAAAQGTDFSSAAITGTGAFQQVGTGTTTLNAANTYGGATTVTAGTLALADTTGAAAGSTSSVAVSGGGTLMFSSANQLNASAPITLGIASVSSGKLSTQAGASQGAAASVTGGTVSGAMTTGGTVTGSTTQGLGALTLNNTATLAYSGISTMVFGTFTPNSNVLTITGYTNTSAATAGNSGVDGTDDRLVFQGDQSGNLNFFNFGAGAGVNVGEVQLDGGFYEVTYETPVPEPATWAAGVLALGALGYRLRRRSVWA